MSATKASAVEKTYPAIEPAQSVVKPGQINIDAPRWDQSTYSGRAKHFFTTTNPLNLLKGDKELEEVKRIIINYKKGDVPAGLTVENLWNAKHVYDSAFHPDTGEKMFILGRMSAQVPCNMFITGMMMTFYKSTPAVVFWQWFNQSFNAIVNYTNRSGDSPISNKTLGTAYALATTGATATALSLNALTKKFPPIVGRFVPFAAVAAANCINIPIIRQRELVDGIPVTDKDGNKIGSSSIAANWAIIKVALSRICMAVPGMVLPPILMNHLEQKTTFFQRYPWAPAPLQIGICGVCLIFATPLCCALFPQRSSISVKDVEPHLQKVAALKGIDELHYNKGL
ncbi:sideroflexin-1-like [Paramacrobiotus metropolitanus]|uniref:sideroflexin-1-like n=1 Tax=Paramacrobiotus metropolitanus TaxID=2943436 RepID=UPI002445F153|nr:sideroflexin-1-like [Paramacrobiotus metropolitanus]XP_055334809.1 sideroflexin-1-like [Paramacrobiotus metropolitanus]XP_055334810.1 sideroflexin-1-like [Paramacrobiotus metropolitanus]